VSETTRPERTATDMPAMTDPQTLPRRVITALAMLTLGACAAHSFSTGNGAPAGNAGSSPSHASSQDWSRPGAEAPGIDPTDPVTAATDRVNASTPNNAGRAKTYPDPADIDDNDSYGPNGSPERGDGYFVTFRRRYLILAGYTLDEATRRLKAAGFTGNLNVNPEDHFNPKCPANTVCRVYPGTWQNDLDGRLTLYINRSVEISSPK